MAKKTKSVIDDIIIFIWTYVVVALPPLAILYVFPTTAVVSTLDFSTLAAVSIILPVIGSALSIWRKKMHFSFFWNLDRQTKLHITTISLLLSIVLWQFFSVFSFLSYFGLIILFLFFLLYLPLSTNFFNSINFNKLKVFIMPKKRISKIYVIKRICYLLVILLLIHTLVMITDNRIRAYNHYQSFLSRHPTIEIVKPGIAYYDTQVILTGKGFGWKGKIDTEFKYQDGIINISLWTDTKVIFTVPLHWKTGDITIWIQKPIEWDGKNIKVNSNKVKLHLISRDDGWGRDDDAYFEQLKHLDKETLKINGY